MSHGARNWPFLTLTTRPVLAGGDQQIGLAAKKGRNLQNIDHFGEARALIRLMHVGEHGDTELVAQIGENLAVPGRGRARVRSPREVRFALSNEVL